MDMREGYPNSPARPPIAAGSNKSKLPQARPALGFQVADGAANGTSWAFFAPASGGPWDLGYIGFQGIGDKAPGCAECLKPYTSIGRTFPRGWDHGALNPTTMNLKP